MTKKEEPTLTITGFKSRLEMQTFIDWYSGAGESDLSIWLDARRCDGEDVREYLNCTSGITTGETQGYMKIGNPADA